MNYVITAIVFALIALAVFVVWQLRKLKADRKMELIDLESDLVGRIQSTVSAMFELNDQRKLEIKALEASTLKAKEGENGELIITAPDGKTKIDEFKLMKK